MSKKNKKIILVKILLIIIILIVKVIIFFSKKIIIIIIVIVVKIVVLKIAVFYNFMIENQQIGGELIGALKTRSNKTLITTCLDRIYCLYLLHSFKIQQ